MHYLLTFFLKKKGKMFGYMEKSSYLCIVIQKSRLLFDFLRQI